VKDELALGVLIVTAEPISTLEALRVGVVALGIVLRVPVPLPLFVPILDPEKVIPNSCEKEYEKLLVPSALWLIVVLPLAKVLVVLFDIPTLFVPL
jgi:hypothetical protein